MELHNIFTGFQAIAARDCDSLRKALTFFIPRKIYTSSLMYLEGQCQEIFCFWFFSWIGFPPAPEYSIKTALNFFENSRRYSQVKVLHWYQRHRRQIFPPFSIPLLICHWCKRDTGGKYFELQSTVNLKQNFWTCSFEWPCLRDPLCRGESIPLNSVKLLTLKNLSRGVGDNCFSKMIF